MSRLKATALVCGFLCLTLPLMPVQFLALRFWPRLARRVPPFYHRCLCRLLGIRIAVSGDVPPAGGALWVVNHASWLDITILGSLRPLSFIAKREVAGWPLFGQLAKLQRTVFVDRARRQRTGHSRSEIARRLAQADTLVLFPEGTSGHGASLLPFKSALFAAAEQAQCPIYPITLAFVRQHGLPITFRQRPSYAWYGDMALLPHIWAMLQAGPLDVQVIVHEPLSPAAQASRKAMAQAAEAQIRAGLANALHGRLKMR